MMKMEVGTRTKKAWNPDLFAFSICFFNFPASVEYTKLDNADAFSTAAMSFSEILMAFVRGADW